MSISQLLSCFEGHSSRYGGGIWHSWLDRDLSVAGRVVTADSNGGFSSKLIKIDRPIIRIPTLAIHRSYSLTRIHIMLLTYNSGS